MNYRESVSEYLGDLVYKLEANAEHSDYWEKACDFVHQNYHLLLSELTIRQRSWLLKIKEDLE